MMLKRYHPHIRAGLLMGGAIFVVEIIYAIGKSWLFGAADYSAVFLVAGAFYGLGHWDATRYPQTPEPSMSEQTSPERAQE